MSAEEPSEEIVEALAKRMFRGENPPDLLWDATLLQRAGLSTDGYRFADEAVRAEYLDKARAMLLDPAA